jgi:DNA replication protein DnaC
MKAADPIDAARVELLLAELRLPAVKLVWADLAAQADKEGWPAARFLAALAEHEIAERGRRRIERHLAEAKLPPGKTIDTFDFAAVPVVSKAQVMALAAGDAWLNRGANLILFGPPGTGKSHLAAALGFALVTEFRDRYGREGKAVRGLTVEQHLQHLRESLLPLAERCGRVMREALAALEDLRAVPSEAVERSRPVKFTVHL